jgi:hypothetical protein
MKKKICINNKIILLSGIVFFAFLFMFVVNSISNQRVAQSARAQFDSTSECAQKYGVGSVCMYGFGIASFPGYLKGDACSGGYCYYKDEDYVAPLTECQQKHGSTAICSIGFGLTFPGYLKGSKCTGGYCVYKDPTYVAPLTECEEVYGKGLAHCEIGTGLLGTLYPGYIKGQSCSNGLGHCFYKTAPTATPTPAPAQTTQTSSYYYAKIRKSLITNSGASDLTGLTFTVTCMGHKGTRLYDINSYDGNYYYFSLAANSNSCTGVAECSIVGNPTSDYLSKASCNINKSVEFTSFEINQ